jgi:hypothetical protein
LCCIVSTANVLHLLLQLKNLLQYSNIASPTSLCPVGIGTIMYIVQYQLRGAQDGPLNETLCGRDRCDKSLVAAALAPVLPALLPAELAEVAEAVAALRPAPPDAAQLLLLIASRCLRGLPVLLCRTTAQWQAVVC